MKRTRFGQYAAFVTLAVLAAVACITPSAHAAGGVGTIIDKVSFTWQDTGKDTTFMQDETDTTRTNWISTRSWDADALMHNGNAFLLPVYFFATGSAIPEATDTLYYTVEKRFTSATGRIVLTQNRSLAASAGACAIAETGTANNRVWVGYLTFDADAAQSNQTISWGDEFRLRVAGDQGGTSPRVSGLAGCIYFPKRIGL